jgi:preprotein translocase subunit SecE
MAAIVQTTKPGTLESMKQWPEITRNYIADLQLEMKRVTWPTRAQVQATTAIVIITVFAFAAYFKIVDEIIVNSVGKLYSTLTK